ncbi:hypothetical protein PDESU_04409 [Pontiella desulfatans]|uniref:Uncharacterized protein n=1 Tax=Pontiella desulfatans TaxID=2750659 RepID=A0A6C2U6X5_PONDE|nr:hypothetical protein [Pontiella desulfatans]VGO15822.1 hypothetical protein PDESU_04409 [Pontiella desulfatans]
MLGLKVEALERTDLLPPAKKHVRITQAETLWKEFSAAYGDRLRADEKVQDFVEAFEGKVKKKIAEGKLKLEIRQLFEILKLLKGEIALVYDDEQGSALTINRMFLAATATDEEFGRIVERTDWLQGQTDEAFRKREMFQGTEIIHDIMRGGSTNEMNCWLACTHGTLLLGSEREWVEQSMVRLKNETITEPEGSKISCRFPLGQWTRNDLAQKAPDERAKSESIWDALGIMGIEHYLLDIEMKEGDLVLDGTLALSEQGKGLFALLDTTPEDFSDDRIVPEHATSFSYGKIDLPALWEKIPEILGGMPRKDSVALTGLFAFFEQQSGLSIEHDLMAQLGERFTLHSESISTNQPMLVSLELKDGKVLEASLNKLLASPFAKAWAHHIETTDFRDRTIYFKKNKKNPATEAFALCVCEDYLFFGNTSEILRNAILRHGRTATPSALRETARALAPENSFGYGGMNHRKAPALIYIKMSDSSFSAGVGFTSNPEGKKEELGENEISLRHLATFLQNTYHYAEAVPGGIHHRLVIEHTEKQGAP